VTGIDSNRSEASMKLMTRIVLMLSFTAASVVLGCGGEDDAPVDPIPTELAAVESAAEAGFDAALAGDRSAINVANTAIASHWANYRQQAPRDGVPADAVSAVDAGIADALRLAAANATAPALARAFNVISAPMARIYAVYHPPVPADLLDLDHLGRELIVDAREADFARAGTDLDHLLARWTAFRSVVIASGGATQATAMDRALAAARQAIAARDSAAVEAAAVTETDVVDEIETLFADRNRDPPD
jgi:hypothetical protein